MRQSQHGKKPRGRGRKQHNPLSRVYDSNGPDVKVRGTAAHVADKYMNLARDAQSSGDPVAAENYLQHAEHYLRIIAAAQAQMQPPVPMQNEQPAGPYSGDNAPPREAGDEANGHGERQPNDRGEGEESEHRPRRRRRPAARSESADGANGGRRNGQERPNPGVTAESPAEEPADAGPNDAIATDPPAEPRETTVSETSEKSQTEAGV